MSLDSETPLAAAARRRHEQAIGRAREVLQRYEDDGRPLTYGSVAQAAKVSRAWLYTQPDIRAAIDQLRNLNGRSTKTSVPTRQRTSGASLLRRLEAAHARNQRLAGELAELRDQLAVAHSELRALRRTTLTGSATESERAD